MSGVIPHPSEQPTLTIDEARSALNLSRSAAYQAARAGDIPVIRIGRTLRVPTAALRRMLAIDVQGGDIHGGAGK